MPRRASDRHQPAHALGDLIEAGALVIGAVLPEAGDAAIDQPRVDGRQRVIVDAKALFDIRSKVFDDHIGLGDQAMKYGEAARVLEVKRHRALIAMQVLEISAMAWAARLLRTGVIAQGIDLDDVGAPIRELADSRGAGSHPGQIKDGKS